ncbi:eukaryotic translation initiation factor 2 subunit [Anaeramoeba flamelloides]|uniref:Eukaryotic translation initiation factor 2 subunit n=1 Tax=Anaeramoeba flamelloides TaxID=1746091 RepID=A0AAV7Z8I0_9EUKA|nr:eukaryotic translation initiation factor 2 subunit [Anaeramoeba flamelloides]
MTKMTTTTTMNTESQQAQQQLGYQLQQYRYYPNKLPEIGDYVLFTPQEYLSSDISGHLPEYNNLECFLSHSQITNQNVQSYSKFIKPDRPEICVVLGVDPKDNHVALSRKQANDPLQRKYFKGFVKKSKLVDLIMKQLSHATGVTLKKLYKQIVFPLYSDYHHPLDGLKAFLYDHSVFDKYNFSSLYEDLNRSIRVKIHVKNLQLQADIQITCYSYEGIGAIQKSLIAAEKVGTKQFPIIATLVASPIYRITTTCSNRSEGIKLLNLACKKVKSVIESKDGSFQIVQAPRVVRKARN